MRKEQVIELIEIQLESIDVHAASINQCFKIMANAALNDRIESVRGAATEGLAQQVKIDQLRAKITDYLRDVLPKEW